MGITGLLPFLKKIHVPVNVSKFAGCTVAIDAYCWLHKGAFSCAEKLALGEKTDQYVYYCMKFINNLLANNVKPIMVFDGCHLPSKKNVETSRREKREINRKKAAQFLREGRKAEARECLQRCIDISPEMALNLMNACRAKGVDCIVAPYEADAQLAYLNKIGVAQVIITEDSDLLLFGCERVLFKMDHAGNGMLIEKSRLNEVMNLQGGHYTFEKFRYMCILSGCDYLASLSGIGLVKANKVFKIARQPDIQLLLKKLSTYLKTNITVPQEYIDGFIQADNTFLYQLVFDPLRRKLVPLTPYPPDITPEDVPYAGPHMNSDRGYQLALGNINIYSNEKFANYNPDTYVPKQVKKKPESLHLLSMWDRNYRIRPKAGLTEVQPSDRPGLTGKEVIIRSNFRKASPQKRLRDADDSSDVISNSELSTLYVQHSPSKKRLKQEDSHDMKDDLQRFMFSADQKLSEDDIDECAEDEKQSGDGPEFFSSLSEAHPEPSHDPAFDEEDKENGLTSPQRNVFASKSPSKKPRFNLNATKPAVVKSRFFAKSGKQLKLSKSLKNVQKVETPVKSETLSGYQLVHENTANVNTNDLNLNSKSDEGFNNSEQQIAGNESELVDLSEDSSTIFNKQNSVDSNTPYVQSPTSAFNWSRFKFASKDGACNNQNTSKLVSSPHPQGRFKFKSDRELRKSFNNIKQSDSDSNKQCLPQQFNEGDQTDAYEGANNFESSLSASFQINIGRHCMPNLPAMPDYETNPQETCEDQITISQNSNSQESVQSVTSNQPRKKGLSIYFKTAPTHSNKEGEIEHDIRHNEGKAEEIKSVIDDAEVVLIASDNEDNDTTAHISANKVKSTALSRKPLKQNADKPKSGCRVSGLSKRTKTVKVEDKGKQQSLKDMFSKFAHCKSSKPKLHHDSVVSCTPESDSSLLNKDNRIQKQLQL